MEEAELLAEGRITSDILGYGVGFDGTTVVAGAPFGTFQGVVQGGRAFVFAQRDGAWRQVQMLLPSRREGSAFFGVACAVDGDRLAVAAPSEDAGVENAGAVYVFREVRGAWEQEARLVSPAPVVDERFGSALAMEGNRLLVGAPGRDDFAGVVYEFVRSDGLWGLAGEIQAAEPESGAVFGANVGLRGEEAIIGEPFENPDDVLDAGATYVFSKATDAWTQMARLTASTASPGQEFGHAVSLDGHTVVVGTEVESSGEAAYAFIFERHGNAWREVAALTSPEGPSGDVFGEDVSVEGQTVVVGAYLGDHDGVGGAGLSYVYRRTGDGWSYDRAFYPQRREEMLFGWRLALRDNRVAVAAPFHTLNQGAVYVFGEMHSAGACTRQERLSGLKCKTGGDALKLVVKLLGGTPGGRVSLETSGGASRRTTLDDAGKGRVKLRVGNDAQGWVRATWDCGALDTMSYDCR